MQENKKGNFERFIEFYEKQSDLEKEKINSKLYDEIHECAVVFLKKEYDRQVLIIDELKKLISISEQSNRDEITEIYLYEGQFGNNSAELMEIFSRLILTIIADKYDEGNMDYIEQIILNDTSLRGEVALEFYIKIGKVYNKHENRVLNFIENEYKALSNNQQNLTIGLLKTLFDKNTSAKKIINESGIDEIKMTYSNATANKADNQDVNNDVKPKKAWWKFW